MKKFFTILLISFCFSYQAQTETSCLKQIEKYITINQEENWSKIFNSSCIFKQDILFLISNKWGNILYEAKSFDEIKQFSVFKKDNNGQRIMPAGTYSLYLEFSIEGENQPRKATCHFNILD